MGDTAEFAAAQARLAEIWGNVLARDAVGPEEHFFDLGGDSLAATLIAAAAEDAFAVVVEPGDVYANPTLEYFTRAVLEKLAEKARGAG